MSFAHMTPEQRREFSRKGGKAAHAKGTAYRFTRETAKAAGSKGGRATQAKLAAERAESGT